MKEDRVCELAQKILLPENEPIRKYANEWVIDSSSWAQKLLQRHSDVDCDVERVELRKRYQLLYILNHLCPSLHHFERSPNSLLPFEMEKYNEVSLRYWAENSQRGVEKRGDGLDRLLSIWRDAGLISKEDSEEIFNLGQKRKE